MKLILTFLILLVSIPSWSVIRFKKDQIKFSLLDSDGQVVSCKHEPLTNQSPAPPPPWWTVTCESRTYVVDVWMDLTNRGKGYSFDFMFHAKESTSSSGEKKVRFDSHLTRLDFDEKFLPKTVSSNIDVRNGLADLRVTAHLGNRNVE